MYIYMTVLVLVYTVQCVSGGVSISNVIPED